MGRGEEGTRLCGGSHLGCSSLKLLFFSNLAQMLRFGSLSKTVTHRARVQHRARGP